MAKKVIVLTEGDDIWGGWQLGIDYEVYGLGGKDALYGYLGDDILDGGNGKDKIYGGAGNDKLFGDNGDDLLDGGSGNDTLYGGQGNDLLFGGVGNDFLFGGADNDLMFGYDGVDFISGGDGQDVLYGENDDDILQGDKGDDLLYGGTGNDVLMGGKGNDVLYGLKDNDVLDGADNDSENINKIGAQSIDTLVGGSGSDKFVLGNLAAAYYDDGQALGNGTHDYAVIKDLHRLTDKIQLFGSIDNYVVSDVPLDIAGQHPAESAGIFIDKDHSNSLTGNDELIAVVENVSASRLVLDKGLFMGTDGSNTQFSPATSADWELVFSDEFSGSALDISKWNTRYYHDIYGGRTNVWNDEKQYYVGDNEVINGVNYDAFEFNNDVLSIVGQKLDQPIAADILHPLEGIPSTQTFECSSGILSGHDKFAFTNGYMEIRAQVPAGTGLWPAFWLLPTSGDWPPEIDVMEFLGDRPDTIYTSSHFVDATGGHGINSAGQKFSGEDGINFAAGFHTYAAAWSSDRLTWFIDGQAVFDVRQNVPDVPMYLLANLAIGGTWPGDPDATTPETSHFDIDYIRVYQDHTGTLFGGAADDTLTKNLGNISGEGGNDRLTGGLGNNILDGGAGNDRLVGSMGLDTFIGGAGIDEFVLANANGLYYDDGNASTAGMADFVTIKDFNLLEDTVTLLGSASNYALNSTFDGLSTEIWSQQATNDLIAVLDRVQVNNFDRGFMFI